MIRPRVGDRVRVKSSVTKPKYNWGQVKSTSIGKLTRIDDDGDCCVNFPEQSGWTGLLTEMEVVGASATEVVAVGARVKILSASDSSTTPYVGQDGDLVEDDGTDRPYRVQFADGEKWWFRKDEVVLASGSSTVTSGSVLKTKEVGVRVRRGPDWKWGDQDGNGLGTTQSNDDTGWIRVKWDHGESNSYRIGKDGAYDLVVAERIRCTKHHHALIARSLPNRCDVGGAGCRGVGTVYRCASGCDWDVCQVCFDANSSGKTIKLISVGSRVKILSASDSSTGHKVGQDGDLVEDDGTDRPYRVKFADGETWWFRKPEVTLASTLSAGAAIGSITVGARVKVISATTGGIDDGDIGMVGTVFEDDGSSVPYHVNFDNGRRLWLRRADLALASGEMPLTTSESVTFMNSPIGEKCVLMSDTKVSSTWGPSIICFKLPAGAKRCSFTFRASGNSSSTLGMTSQASLNVNRNLYDQTRFAVGEAGSASDYHNPSWHFTLKGDVRVTLNYVDCSLTVQTDDHQALLTGFPPDYVLAADLFNGTMFEIISNSVQLIGSAATSAATTTVGELTALSIPTL